jgi:hypothetical protein
MTVSLKVCRFSYIILRLDSGLLDLWPVHVSPALSLTWEGHVILLIAISPQNIAKKKKRCARTQNRNKPVNPVIMFSVT